MLFFLFLHFLMNRSSKHSCRYEHIYLSFDINILHTNKMNQTNSTEKPEQKFRHTIQNDFKGINFGKDFSSEYKSLSNFYLDSEKKSQLESMTPIQRWVHKFAWLTKSMFLHFHTQDRLSSSIYCIHISNHLLGLPGFAVAVIHQMIHNCPINLNNQRFNNLRKILS
jgi:hypothetical protein